MYFKIKIKINQIKSLNRNANYLWNSKVNKKTLLEQLLNESIRMIKCDSMWFLILCICFELTFFPSFEAMYVLRLSWLMECVFLLLNRPLWVGHLRQSRRQDLEDTICILVAAWFRLWSKDLLHSSIFNKRVRQTLLVKKLVIPICMFPSTNLLFLFAF